MLLKKSVSDRDERSLSFSGGDVIPLVSGEHVSVSVLFFPFRMALYDFYDAPSGC